VTTDLIPPAVPIADAAPRGGKRRGRRKTSLFARGEPNLWLVGGALAICLLMVVGLLALIFVQGFSTFWPSRVAQIRTPEGATILGEITRSDVYEPEEIAIQELPEATQARAREFLAAHDGQSRRRLVRTGNFELTGEHFEWVDDFQVVEETQPTWAVVLERQSWGRFYGTPSGFRIDGEVVATEPAAVWAKVEEHLPAVQRLWHEKKDIEKHDLGDLSYRREEARLERKRVELKHGKDSDA